MTNPTQLILVTGHVFGIRAFEGIFASQAFLNGEIEIPLMIGLDDKYSSSTVGYRSIANLAIEQGVSYLSTTDGRLTSLKELIRHHQPHYILVIGWSRLVAQEILAIPHDAHAGTVEPGSAGCIGMHPTRLPSGRGQAPIPWTIIKRLDSTALSVFFLEATADAGSIIAQHTLDMRPHETASSLFYRMAHLHFNAGFDLADQLGARTVKSIEQEASIATVWPKRRPSDGEIKGTMTYSEIEALVRALLGPYPRAFVSVHGQRHVIGRVEPVGSLEEYHGGQAWLVSPERIRFRGADSVVDLILVSG